MTELNQIDRVQCKIEDYSDIINKVVDNIVKPYCNDLDNYVEFIKNCLHDGNTTPSDLELDDYCLNLSAYIYFAGEQSEKLGIKDDISRMLYKEAYHSVRSAQDKGTVSDKDSVAELLSQSEQVTNICYSRAAKIMKSKVENAQELLSSCKKVITRRMNEYSVTHMTN